MSTMQKLEDAGRIIYNICFRRIGTHSVEHYIYFLIQINFLDGLSLEVKWKVYLIKTLDLLFLTEVIL